MPTGIKRASGDSCAVGTTAAHLRVTGLLVFGQVERDAVLKFWRGLVTVSGLSGSCPVDNGEQDEGRVECKMRVKPTRNVLRQMFFMNKTHLLIHGLIKGKSLLIKKEKHQQLCI